MTEPEVPVQQEGPRRLWIALAVTAVAVPLLVLDNLDTGNGGDETTTTRVVAPVSVPDNRPETGPTKGISVVTSSTTSSTQPIIVTTTTLAD